MPEYSIPAWSRQVARLIAAIKLPYLLSLTFPKKKNFLNKLPLLSCNAGLPLLSCNAGFTMRLLFVHAPGGGPP
jgi:hypothetical protein